MSLFHIREHSHHFVVTGIDARTKPLVDAFSRRFIQYGLVKIRGGFTRAPVRVYAASNNERTEYRFHINSLRAFKEFLPDWAKTPENLVVEKAEMYEPVRVDLPIFEKWVVRDYQEPVIDYIVTPEPISKLVGLQTGQGKSFCAMKGLSELGVRGLFIFKPMYIDKWLIDLRKTYDIEFDDIMVVQGSKQLIALQELVALEELTAKVIIISNKTLQNWIKLYEKLGDECLSLGYLCHPHEFMEYLGIGQRIIDELHQDFHLNFKIDLYSHVPQSLGLSATMISDDAHVNQMYELAYPSVERHMGAAYKKYIATRSVFYGLAEVRKVRTSQRGDTRYSHHAFEESILKYKDMTSRYFEMIKREIDYTYIQEKLPGERAIVFCSSVDMCTALVKYLERCYPTLNIKRYAGTENDPYEENLIQPDIRVTTLQSAGTAVDIPMLYATFLTVAITSSQSNVQGLGRLRELASGRTPVFTWFVCEDVPKHIEYHERKRVLMADITVSYKPAYTGTRV